MQSWFTPNEYQTANYQEFKAPGFRSKWRAQAIEPTISVLNVSIVTTAVLVSVQGGAGFKVNWTPKIYDLYD